MQLDKEKVAKAFGKTILHFRHKVGISQEGLAYESGISRSYIYELEKGRKQPSLYIILCIADVLKVRPSKMFVEIEKNLNW